MFDFVERNKRLLQVFMVVIALSFMTWGLESYTRVGGSVGVVAHVNDSKITEREFTDEMRRQQERLRALLGPNFDPASMDSPETRSAMLDTMIAQRLVALEAARAKLLVGDESLRDMIVSIPAFQAGGTFSKENYEAVLRAQGQTPAAFEAGLRFDMSVGNLTRSIAETAIQPRALAERLAALENQKREVQEALVPAAQFEAQVKIDEAQVKAHYDSHQVDFRTPERVRAEFVVLSAEALGAAEIVSDEELKKAYEARSAQFRTEEQRRASHILIQAPADAKPADREAAKKRAEELLAEAKRAPAKFADLARKHSQDPGSSGKGGDLGLLGRGMVVKSFEDALFRLKEGEIAGPVASEFGFHVIMLTELQPSKARPLEDVRKDLAAELAKQKGQRKFAEAAEIFSNTVYEQADSLKPAAERLKLEVRTSAWIDRNPSAEAGPLAHAKLLAALFSPDSIKSRRNTDAIEVASNTLVSARVLEHRPAAVRPFAEAKAEIEAHLKQRESARLAHKDGAAKLAALEKGKEAGLKWSATKQVSRRAPEDVPQAALSRILAVDAAKLPGLIGIERSDGYALYRVLKVLPLEARPEDQQKADIANAERRVGSDQYAAYLEALRSRAKIEIPKDKDKEKEKEKEKAEKK